MNIKSRLLNNIRILESKASSMSTHQNKNAAWKFIFLANALTNLKFLHKFVIAGWSRSEQSPTNIKNSSFSHRQFMPVDSYRNEVFMSYKSLGIYVKLWRSNNVLIIILIHLTMMRYVIVNEKLRNKNDLIVSSTAI